MTPKRWLVLLFFYISYLFLGASIYYYIENNLEIERRAEALQERIQINEYLMYHLHGKNTNVQEEILTKITNYCGKPVTNYTTDEYEVPFVWNFYHSLFFAFTVCSTVGYGNLAPTTTLGRMIMIAYSLIGIPVNGILFAGLGEFFTNFFTNIYRKYKKYKMANDDLYVPYKFGLFATIMTALIPGVTFFIIVPSILFSYFEGWPFTLSIYYSYVTTTTIGFGDYVPTFQSHQEHEFGVYFILYQIFIIIWFIFSLGYLVMIMTFITRALRSKKLFVLEQQLKDQIKITQHRIWHGVTKDIGYLRHILNELYINAKPLYVESEQLQCASLPKSSSCPELEMYAESTCNILNRKRAFSESFDQLLDGNIEQLANGTPIHGSLLRVASDTNLNKLNKEKTIETVNAFKETTNLLAKVVSALNNIQPLNSNEDITNSNNTLFGAYNGFSDSQILSSEGLTPTQTLGVFHRSRAQSDFHLNPKIMPTNLTNEWTWGGDNNQIQQVINDRVRLKQNNQIINKSNLLRLDSSKSDERKFVSVNLEENEVKSKMRKFSTESLAFIKRLLPFRKDKEQRRNSTFPVESNKYDIQTANNYYTVHDVHTTPNREENITINSNGKTINNLAKQISNRRHSLFVRSELRSSVASKSDIQNGNAPKSKRNRSGSLFQRSNNFSVFREPRYSFSGIQKTASRNSISIVEEEEANLLEQTTIADIIRAIETLHTKGYALSSSNNEITKNRKKRKIGTATPPNLPPILTLFNDKNEENTKNQRRWSGFEIPNNQKTHTSFNNTDLHTRIKSESLSEDLEHRKKYKRFSIRPVKEENLLQPPEKRFDPAMSSKTNPVARQSMHARTPLSRIAQMQSMRKNSGFI